LTDKFVPQINPITVTEFALWYWSIYQVNGVGFYNSNKIAGASQLHRHLQLIPMDVIAGMRNVDAVYVRSAMTRIILCHESWFL
jgi:ATP adenylyltransferase/5',5'''-P-1,P-4-tetraphosphate phosphorylase II